MNVCAPGKKFENGSCLTIDNLVDIAKAGNINNMNNKHNKKLLLNRINKTMQEDYNCEDNDQVCWVESKLVKKMNNNDINLYTFRPTGPKSKYEWLSTTDINKVMMQYENLYSNFKFYGAIPYDFDELPQLDIYNVNFDELKNNKKHIFGAVINLDKHDQSGSHWVALYTHLNENKIYYFDSFGKKPGKRLTKFIRNILTYMYNTNNKTNININEFLTSRYNNNNNFDVRYNKIQHQLKNSECGVYSMNFIIRLLNGETFDNIIGNITKDEAMNECRQVYFRN